MPLPPRVLGGETVTSSFFGNHQLWAFCSSLGAGTRWKELGAGPRESGVRPGLVLGLPPRAPSLAVTKPRGPGQLLRLPPDPQAGGSRLHPEAAAPAQGRPVI